MAEQSRPSRYIQTRSYEAPMNNSGAPHTDRRNGYPGRVFYASASRESSESSYGGYRGYYEGSHNNNNMQHLTETALSIIETRNLFRELPMNFEDTETANGYGFPKKASNNGQKKNWYMDSPQQRNFSYSSNPNRNNKNAHSSFCQGPKSDSSLSHTLTSGALPNEWVNAPEFIPNSATSNGTYATDGSTASGVSYDHCGVRAVSSNNGDRYKRKTHRRSYHQQLDENSATTSAAMERSKDKTCGICFEVVVEKPAGERRFGILTMCNHCFCLDCIRKWRMARSFENKVVRSCPECRTSSDFVCPSVFWVDTKEAKDKLIEKYKKALSEKDCKYFRQGHGVCPFGNKCFYLHALPDGTITDVGPPPRRRRSQFRHTEDLDLNEILQQILLWDIDDLEQHFRYSFNDDLEELASFFSDSDESEWSDYDCM